MPQKSTKKSLSAPFIGMIIALSAAVLAGLSGHPFVAWVMAGITAVLFASASNAMSEARAPSSSSPESTRLTGGKRSKNRSVADAAPKRRITVDDQNYGIAKPEHVSSKSRTFLPKNGSIRVAGVNTGGLIYYGKTGYNNHYEPAVIDPSLDTTEDGLPIHLGYWPNYSEIEPRQRFEYLTWLSGDRGYCDQIGYVFLYFYGFERYVLIDAQKDREADRNTNLRDIAKEIVRLRKIFKESRSFNSYAQQLLDLIAIKYWPQERLIERSRELPWGNALAVRHAIITHANSDRERPLDADWALQWVILLGSAGRTRAVRENYAMLRSLFRAAYEREPKGGVVLPKCKSKARLAARPAALGLDSYASIQYPGDWFDPSLLKKPLSKLEEIFRDVMLSVRKLAKGMQSNDPVAILAAWPSGLPIDGAPKLKQYADKVGVFLDKHPAPPLSTLAKLFKMDIEEKATAKQLRDLAAALSACGRVLVPDPAIKSVSLKAEDIVFTYPGERVSSMSSAGRQISTFLQVGVMLALADGELDEREAAILEKQVQAHRDGREREYLGRYLRWRMAQKPNATGLKKQIDQLSHTDKADLAKTLIEIALADGALPASEIKELEKLFKRLGLEGASVTSRLHEASSRSPGVAGDSQIDAGTPSSVPAENRRVEIDEKSLESHRKSTEEVQSVLSTIFEEADELAREPDSEPSSQSAEWHEGQLDKSHSALAEWLLTGDEWSMEQVREKCTELGLMPEGALAMINEAAFESLGDSLLEIGDSVEIYHDALEV